MLLASENLLYRRQVACCLLSLSSCLLWGIALTGAGGGTAGLPWYLTICASALYFCRYLLNRQVRVPEMIYQLGRQPGGHGGIGGREPLSFSEALAISLFVASMALYLWTCLKPAFAERQQLRKIVQIVDIQLVSDKDFADRQSPMPGTQIEENLHKRSGDKVSRQATASQSIPQPAQTQSNTPTKNSQPAPKTPTAKRQPEEAPQAVPASKNQPMLSIIHTPPKPLARPTEPTSQTQKRQPVLIASASPPQASPLSSASPAKQAARPAPRANDQAFMQEVQVSDLVEMVDNDGQQDQPAMFQAGGHSSGGKGANNELSDFLKELHKRIKSAWSPPRGQSRTAKLLFRLNRDGSLAVIRVSTSSGDSDTDVAAIKAVRMAANHKLPESFNGKFLDVLYTFSYNADQLQEMPTE